MGSPEGEYQCYVWQEENVKGFFFQKKNTFFFPRKIPPSSYCDSQMIKARGKISQSN